MTCFVLKPYQLAKCKILVITIHRTNAGYTTSRFSLDPDINTDVVLYTQPEFYNVYACMCSQQS